MLVIWRYCDVDPKVTSVFTGSTSLSSLFLNVLLIEFLHVLQLTLDQLALILAACLAQQRALTLLNVWLARS